MSAARCYKSLFPFLLSPSAVRHVTYNIDVQYIDVQYSGSPQRETWSKSSNAGEICGQYINQRAFARNVEESILFIFRYLDILLFLAKLSSCPRGGDLLLSFAAGHFHVFFLSPPREFVAYFRKMPKARGWPGGGGWARLDLTDA